MRIASLCSGYEGIGLGLAMALGIDLTESLAWHAELDDAPARVHSHHFPHVPNYRDIKTICWPLCEPVDWLTAGYPCQPFSLAGQRKGVDDPRHLWPHIAEAVRILRPARVLLENVPGHLSKGFGTVLGDLAEVGYDARWICLPASGVGAPHKRERVYVLATDADRAGLEVWSGVAADPCTEFSPLERESLTTADSANFRHERPRVARIGGNGPSHSDNPSTDADNTERRTDNPPRRDMAERLGLSTGRLEDSSQPAGGTDQTFGRYASAIERWERVIGRHAPRPTELNSKGNQRLSPRFAEWMMGLPDDWVTSPEIGLTRTQQLKTIGNGVVPQQCAKAVRWLLT